MVEKCGKQKAPKYLLSDFTIFPKRQNHCSEIITAPCDMWAPPIYTNDTPGRDRPRHGCNVDIGILSRVTMISEVDDQWGVWDQSLCSKHPGNLRFWHAGCFDLDQGGLCQRRLDLVHDLGKRGHHCRLGHFLG